MSTQGGDEDGLLGAELFDKFVKGDESAYVAHYDHYKLRIYLFLCAQHISEPDVEDIMMRTFAKLWDHRATLKGPAHLKNWLYDVARNDLINLQKSQRANDKKIAASRLLADPDFFELQCISSEWINWLYEGLKQLPPQQQKIVRLRFLEERPVKEIATSMEISVKTVSNQLARGLAKLRSICTKEEFSKYFQFLLLLADVNQSVASHFH
jgi:RNA polymerase sigma-70 factor (ECF subfamily)